MGSWLARLRTDASPSTRLRSPMSSQRSSARNEPILSRAIVHLGCHVRRARSTVVSMASTHPRRSDSSRATVVRPMPRTDLVAPSAQAEGHVSDEAQRLAELIYDPVHDRDGAAGVKKLRKVAAATRSLQQRSSGRYLHRKAAAKTMKPRRVKR
jgi:hypothetical protein